MYVRASAILSELVRGAPVPRGSLVRPNAVVGIPCEGDGGESPRSKWSTAPGVENEAVDPGSEVVHGVLQELSGAGVSGWGGSQADSQRTH